jgi:hypothetical protein
VAALGEGVVDFMIGERVAPEVVLFAGSASSADDMSTPCA